MVRIPPNDKERRFQYCTISSAVFERLYIYISLYILVLAIGFPAIVYAGPLPEIYVEKSQKQRIAFVPHAIPIYHYKDVLLKGEYDVLALKRALIRNAQSNPYLEVISSKEIAQAFETAEADAIDAGTQAEADMGFAYNFMATMNYDSAIVMLRRIVENYEKALYAYYKPHNLALAYQQLAYAYISQYEDHIDDDPSAAADPLHPARLAFLELIRVEPFLTMLEGRQSALRVMLYDQALKLFLETPSYRQTPVGVATALAHRLSADYLVFVRIVQTRDAELKLELDLYRAETQKFEYQSITLTPESTPEAQVERFIEEATYALDAFYACVNIDPRDESFKHFGINGGFLMQSYILHPTRDLPLELGIAIDFTYYFHRLFFAKVGLHIASILHDDARMLNDNFEIYSLPVVAGFHYASKYIRPYIGLGVEFNFTAPYKIVRSQSCKVFGVDDRDCDPSDFNEHNDAFMLNLTAQTGLSFIFAPLPMTLTIELSFDITAYPVERSLFRYPFGGSVSLGYLF